MFLTVAPLVPVLAVATAFGPEAGPALEQESAAPYPLARLLLLRTGAVLLAALPVVLVGQLVFPEAAAWVVAAAGPGLHRGGARRCRRGSARGGRRPRSPSSGSSAPPRPTGSTPSGWSSRRAIVVLYLLMLAPRAAGARPSGPASRHHRKDLVMTLDHGLPARRHQALPLPRRPRRGRPRPRPGHHRPARAQRRRQDDDAARHGHGAGRRRRQVRLLGRDPSDPAGPHRGQAPARLPAAGARLPARLHRVRLRQLHGRPQGVGRPRTCAPAK